MGRTAKRRKLRNKTIEGVVCCQIDLGHGKKSILDVEDYKKYGHYTYWAIHSWEKLDVWVAVRMEGRMAFYLHREIMGLKPGDPRTVIFENGNTLDCRRKNLIRATRQQVRARGKMHKNNLSGFKGVSANGKRWKANITVNWEMIHLGTFDTKEEAHAAYCKAAKKRFGKFATSGR